MGKLIQPDVSIEDALKEPEKWIPKGLYCYYWHDDGNSIFDKTGYLCPFWDRIKDREHQEDGYCHYLKNGDLEFYEENGWLTLLWDMCKECGVNDEDEDWMD